tara:strand:- start:223 stop:1020 length:798 start_codon:yes stop_codon:yes gene_type:complete
MSMLIVGIASAAISLGGTIIGAVGSNKKRKAEEKEKERIGRKISALERNRQPIINPFSNVTDISSMASNLSGMMSNPYGDLGVATGAAEIQMEQSDMALANTLDTLRATGASAGGATALAQAALQSKKGVAASIEQQEANNEKLKAQGEAQLQQVKLSEAQRIQGIQLSEAQRMQQADVAGKQFVFGQKEQREQTALDRAAGQESQSQANINAARANTAGYISGGLSAVGSIGSSAMGAYGSMNTPITGPGSSANTSLPVNTPVN